MKLQDVLEHSIQTGTFLIKSYLEDLSDEELMRRPGGSANTVKWQLGHVLSANAGLLNFVDATRAPKLPDGFSGKYGKECCQYEDPSHYHEKSKYLEVLATSTECALAIVQALPAEDFDKPGPENMRAIIPTVGHTLNLIGLHLIMHSGQIAVLRRELGKPVKV